jgi:hypothetical protein
MGPKKELTPAAETKKCDAQRLAVREKKVDEAMVATAT